MLFTNFIDVYCSAIKTEKIAIMEISINAENCDRNTEIIVKIFLFFVL